MTKLILAGVLALVLSFAVVTYSFAQTATPTATATPTGTTNSGTTTMPSGAPNTGF